MRRCRGSRERVCDACGRVEHVRCDNASTRCRSCASSAAGKKGIAALRLRGAISLAPEHEVAPLVCEVCGGRFHLPPSELAKRGRLFCSKECRSQSLRVVPWRVSFDNSRSNLVPLCLKCHKEVEVITSGLVSAGFVAQDIKRLMGRLLFGRMLQTRLILSRVINEHSR